MYTHTVNITKKPAEYRYYTKMSVKMHVMHLRNARNARNYVMHVMGTFCVYFFPDNFCSFCAYTWHVKSTENGFVLFKSHLCAYCTVILIHYVFCKKTFIRSVRDFIYVSKMYAQYI
jgi:hypothetical protein